ncbi:MAG: hypothetical protein ACTTJK_06965 [Phocaeicola sp.]|uniref:hypothetical protein n=1 Tax=Phocaeicola sp. TaxID=2773926 RepID=UPI003FA10F71
MKTIGKILFGVCCMTAFTACSNDDEVRLAAEQPHEMTLSVNTGADTRTELSVSEVGSGLKRVWKAGDQISVIFQKEVGGEMQGFNEIFTLISGAGTTSGKFYKADSQLPTTGTQTFHLQFPAGTTKGMWVDTSISTQTDGSLATVGDYDVMTAWRENITDGTWDSVTLDGVSSFLHIPTGVKLLEGASGEQTVSKLVMSGTNIANTICRNFDGRGSSGDGNITLSNITLKDGKPASDIYIAFMSGDGGDLEDVKLTLTIGGNDYVVELNDHDTIYDGRVYHLAGGSIKTVPSI